jgi:signal transduction histidine kinase
MGIITGSLALGCFVAAIVTQVRANQPVGEGDVFVAETEAAFEAIATADDLDSGVTHARNALDIEVVSVVGPDATVIASTSETLSGTTVTNGFLTFGIETGRFAALAGASELPILVDGVVEWPVGSVLYQVVSPLPEGEGSVLLHYDVADLLARRSRPGEIQPATIQLIALGATFGLLAGGLLLGHVRASRRYRDLAVESELLRDHSEQLAAKNLELAEARHEAESALALAQEKMRIRSDFVLMINHELRTPLTTVVTGADLVRNSDLTDQERAEVLDAMVANGGRLQEIIDQILAVARIENRGLSYDMAKATIDEVCEVTSSTPRLGDQNDREILVNTDVKTLGLVVSSLVENSRTHGATDVEVICSTSAMRGAQHEVGARPHSPVFIRIVDNGPGIDPEFLPKVFEKFEKNSFVSGTGLGLYMVRLMVEALHGSISVRTSPEGTTFQIALPALVIDKAMESV